MAIDYSLGMLNIVVNLSGYLKSTPDKLLDRVDALLSERKSNQQEISNLKTSNVQEAIKIDKALKRNLETQIPKAVIKKEEIIETETPESV